ncbi:MAG: hypothetical protein V4550_18440 [Gemmatimonadota bacterium]
MARKKTRKRKATKKRKAKLSRKKRAWISRKIRFLIKREGYPQRQAIAIAYRMAGVPRKRARKKGRR